MEDYLPKSKLQLNQTGLFSVIDLKGVKQAAESPAATKGRTQGGRTKEAAAGKIKNTGGIKIGGDFERKENPDFIPHRIEVFERCFAARQAEEAKKPQVPITITLPDGAEKDGTSFVTSPWDIASAISKGLASSSCVAKVQFPKGTETGKITVNIDDDSDHEDDENDGEYELWDMKRPLVASCKLWFCKFDSKEGKETFWHSSSHILGLTLEEKFGCNLSIGPPLDNGFYYDCYMGSDSVKDSDFKDLEGRFNKLVKAKSDFQRCVVTKEEALEMFKDNPFKVSIITNKIPDGVQASVYRCGNHLDLCTGPHIPNTGAMKAMSILRASSAYWLGDAENDSMQRVYGISFPDKKELKKYKKFLEEAEKRDHRKIGTAQELFFFHELSPGSAFWFPHGARIYNTLVQFIQKQLWEREYTEVISPNMFNFDLWYTSGHALHYKDAMFCFDVEGVEFGLKPMNCPGHCLMFKHRLRSYRELPVRYADFGTLHRNELSGALTGLTRVRRFQQDDGHIFCREDQVKDEVKGALEFMKFVYDTFGMTYKLELSTRPKKALGSVELWNNAEASLAAAMDEFGGKGSWRVNPGDGAFYGPKIDIKILDAMERVHQCATVQLDFQLPIRFDLKYRAADAAGDNEKKADEKKGGGKKESKEDKEKADKEKAEAADSKMKRPVIVHRAMLGSVERMSAILIEHYAGKWPFWLSPRQCLVIAISKEFEGYANDVRNRLYAEGFFCDIDDSSKTLNKKVREGQLAQYNFILCAGAKEQESDSVDIRSRDNKRMGTKTVTELLAWFTELKTTYNKEY